MRSVFPSDLPVPENQWSGGSHASIKSASLRAFERVQSIGSLVLRVLKEVSTPEYQGG